MYAMIDLETLSTRHDAAIISIGVAMFDDDKVVDILGIALDMKTVYGHIDPATVKWWSDQNEAVRAYSFNGVIPPAPACMQLKTFFDLHKPTEVWANDPSFDLVILKTWWSKIEEQTHFRPANWFVSHKAERSCRTIYALARQIGINIDDSWTQGALHNPVDDAANQARAVIAARNGILTRVNHWSGGGGR